jgi:pantoate--beta-alanine ligase
MEIVSTADVLREDLSEWRRAGEHIALVPTMGNIHDGHLSLVRLARKHAERVVVSIFVNPTQFGEGEDIDSYPRTIERDTRSLKRAKVDLLFVPDVATIYPFGTDNATSVTVPVLTDDLCGTFRPGHFAGVTTVVSRLFGLVQPDVAVFGQKDYQQQLVIRRMAEDLSLPTKIIAGPTVREEDGLAKSSRNQYLSDVERAIAPRLYAAIVEIGARIDDGNTDYAVLEADAMEKLRLAGFDPEYVSVRRASDLGAPESSDDDLVVLAAARLGAARLIDNLLIRS